MLPRIFSIQNDRDDRLLSLDVHGDVTHPPEDVIGRRVGGRFVIDESEIVRQLSISKYHGHGLAFRTHPVGLVEIVLPIPVSPGQMKRTGQNAFIGGKPAELCFVQKRHHLGADRPFGGPQTDRRPAEREGVVFHGAPDLCFRIAGGMKTGRHGKVRTGAAREVRIDHQRENRVKKRRGRQLHLPAVGQRAVHRDDVLDRGALERQNFSLVVLREASIFLPQGRKARVTLDRTEAEPGEIVPDLKIEEILRGKLPRQLVEILSMDVGATLDEQFVIARKGTDHGRPIG